MTDVIGVSAPTIDLFTHITVDPRLSMLEYGIVPAGVAVAPPVSDLIPAPAPEPLIPTSVITVDPRSQAIVFGVAPAGIVTVAPVVDVAPAPAPAPVTPVQVITTDPQLSVLTYPAASPFASLYAFYHRS